MPYYPMDIEKGHQYETPTYWDHVIHEYTGLNFLQIQELNYIEYLAYRRDAFISQLSKTEKGREYLDNAWRLEQTSPDRNSLKENFGKEVKDGI